MTRSAEAGSVFRTDVIVVGGGVAGLWLLSRLRSAGYGALLLESARLGEGQTRYAQGIIHGGTKYSLQGALSESARAVADMPGRWRQCLAGDGELDLRSAQLLSEHHYLWSSASLTSRMTGFLASHAMRARTEACKSEQRPQVFRDPAFRGQVYALDEPVLDALSVVRALAEPWREDLLQVRSPDATTFALKDDVRVRLTDAEAGTLELQARCLVCCAGAGNEALLAALEQTTPQMQRRPLHMVLAKGSLPSLYAHCLGASANPRLTISTHSHRSGEAVWYMGGQLAEEGVARNADEQIAKAREEIAALLPWVDLSGVSWQTLRIDRAEPLQPDGSRPTESFAQRQGPLITAWPVKMALAPLLADRILALLEDVAPGREAPAPLPDWPRPDYAPAPWDELTWN